MRLPSPTRPSTQYSASRLRRQTLRRLPVYLAAAIAFGLVMYFVYDLVINRKVRRRILEGEMVKHGWPTDRLID